MEAGSNQARSIRAGGRREASRAKSVRLGRTYAVFGPRPGGSEPAAASRVVFAGLERGGHIKRARKPFPRRPAYAQAAAPRVLSGRRSGCFAGAWPQRSIALRPFVCGLISFALEAQ